jgi:hypothetical protein
VLVRLKRDQVSISPFTGGSKVHHDPMMNPGRVSLEPPPHSSSASSSSSQQQEAGGGDSTMDLSGMKKAGEPETAELMLERSKSVGSVPNKSMGGHAASIRVLPHTHRSRSKVIKWLKKTLIKLKN